MNGVEDALGERDKIIEQLTESLKQSLQIRDQLHEQGERLTGEMSRLRRQMADTMDNVSRKRNWLTSGQAPESSGQRLSEITIDLVSGSEYEDEEDFSRQAVVGGKIRAETNEDDDETSKTISESVKQFKKFLSADELRIFSMVQDKFNDHMTRELDEMRKSYEDQMRIDKTERELEINRLKQMLANVKSGSAEVMELRQELDTIHKKEMEDLRMYFERKCSDLEKQ